MKTSITAMACLVIFGLSACATQKDPIWLDAGKVRMTGYTDKNILVFPVEVSPSYRLEPEEERVIQEQILNIMRDVFSLSNLNAPGKIKRFESYPFTQNEVTKLLKLYRADAAVVISVFNFQRSGHYNPETLGIRLAFVDASDPEKAWATSREYVSETGDQIGSAGLKFRITTDLRAVESALRSGGAFSGFVGTVFTFGLWRPPPDDGPRLSITTETSGSTQLGRQLGGTIDTKQSEYSVLITAEDELGIATLEISNLSTKTVIPVEIQKDKAGNLPQFDVATANLSLQPGKNKIVIRATNSNGEETVRKLTLTRIENEDLFVLGVGVANYSYLDSFALDVNDVATRFEDAKRDLEGEIFFLGDEDATRRQIMLGLNKVVTMTAQNADSGGIFYYSGRVLNEDGEFYLAAYDSEEDYVDVSGVPLEFLDKRMRNRGVVILDLCVEVEDDRLALRDTMPAALISFDSCGMHSTSMANRIGDKTNSGLSLRTAINQLYVEESIEQVQQF